MNTYLLILITTLCTIGGQLILKRAVTGLKPLLESGPIEFLFGAATSPLVIAALSLQVLGYVAWLFVLSKEKLSIAFALSGSTLYLLTAIASWYFYGERLTLWQWLGFILISAGVVLVTSPQRAPTMA
jgi:undecaprenyl phosphate-alpha-L-ara4N flippase subunit ArnE